MPFRQAVQYHLMSDPETRVSGFQIAEIIFGIRPEDMHLGSDNDYHWQSKVFVTEKLGSSTFIYLEGEKEPIVMEVAGDTAIKVGDIVKVKLDLEKTHLFNSQNLSILE